MVVCNFFFFGFFFFIYNEERSYQWSSINGVINGNNNHKDSIVSVLSSCSVSIKIVLVDIKFIFKRTLISKLFTHENLEWI